MEEVRAIQRKGGQAYAAAARRRRSIKEAMKVIMELSATKDGQQILAEAGVSDEVTSMAGVIAASMALKAQGGDVEAAKFCRDTIGERPAQGVEVSAGPRPGELAEMSTEELDALEAQLSSESSTGGGETS